MKVQCEQCGAAYSVADEKVAGRKLKQRCRKCGQAIVIDGSSLEAAAPQAESFGVSVPPDTEAVWHIAVGDTTQGPYTLEELGQYYADGHIVLDTLVCRDGWNDWKQAGEVPELVSASRSSAAPAQAQRSRGPMVPQHVAQALGQQVAMGSDPFGEAPDSGMAPALRGGSSPRVSAEEMATPGMQRDGTVQFSMDEIRALSAVSMTSIAPVAPTLPGRATNDDSGLIDMRALAVAEAEAAAAAAHTAQQPAPGGFRPYTPSQVGGLQAVSPLAFAQNASPTVGLDTRTKVFAGLAALGITLGAVVAVVWMQRGNQPGAVAMAAPQPAMQAGVLAAAAQPAAAPEAAAPAAEVPAAAPAAPEPAEAAVAAADPAPKAKARSRSDGDGAASARGSKRKAHSPAADDDELPTKSAAPAKSDADSVDDFITKKAPAKKGSPDIDDLLEGAISAKKAAPKETAPKEEAGDAAGGGLPQTPSRESMAAAYKQASSKVKACKGPGTASASVTISGKSGRATGVNVSGVDGAAKSCVEKAVRSTSFPKFQKDSFEVKFPFKLAG